MELIIGGAYAGKLRCAIEKYGLSPDIVCDLRQGAPAVGCRCYRHLEAFTKRCAEAGLSAEEALSALEPCLESAEVIISREIGSGIVPMDELERRWRELHGQVLSAIARRAERVTRLFLGIPEVLK